MQPASRTPEGSSGECPICGKLVLVEPSAYPTGDVPCPHCGHLLWFDEIIQGVYSQAAEAKFRDDDEYVPQNPPPAKRKLKLERARSAAVAYGTFERVMWIVVTIVSTWFVYLHDGLVISTSLWLMAVLLLGQVALPIFFRNVQGSPRFDDYFYLGVACGWALVPGPIVGVLFGTLLPLVYSSSVTSCTGGLIGMVAGPLLAAMQGLTLVLVIDLLLWAMTGVRLSRRFR